MKRLTVLKVLLGLSAFVILGLCFVAFKAKAPAGIKCATMVSWPTPKGEIFIVSYPDEETETFEVGAAGTTAKSEAVTQKMNEAMNTVCAKGFRVVSSTSHGSSTIFIFEEQ